MDVAEKLRWMDEEYLGKYEQIELDSAIRMQKPFAAPVEIVKPYPVASGEPLTDNSYLSYKVWWSEPFWTKSYTRRLTFWTTHCFLRRERRLSRR